MSLRSRAPTRIDLAGGTIDIWPLYLLIDPAATVNLAIDLYTEVTVEPSEVWEVREKLSGQSLTADSPEALSEQAGAEIAGRLLSLFRPDRPVRLITHSQAPPQSGLGASSSLGIVIAAALNGLTGFRFARQELIEVVKNVEVQVLHAMTGAQDHYPPVFGGANCLWWGNGAHRREPIAVEPHAFEERFLLAYSHQPHRSGATNWEVVKRFLETDEQTLGAAARSGRIASAIRDALFAKDLTRVAELLDEEWDARRAMAPAVSSPEIEALITAAKQAGATSGKACGAGGGGCLLIGVKPSRRIAVRQAIEEAGGTLLEYHLVDRGVELTIDG